MCTDDDHSTLSFFEDRRRRIKVRDLRFPDDSLLMVGPTDQLDLRQLGFIRSRNDGGLFISHTGHDHEFIRENLLWPFLNNKQRKAEVFLQNRVTPGNDVYVHVVGHALLASGSAVVVLSRRCSESQWVPKEIDIILARRIPVVFFVLDDIVPSTIHKDIPHRFGLLDRLWNGRYVFYLRDGPASLGKAITSVRFAKA